MIFWSPIRLLQSEKSRSVKSITKSFPKGMDAYGVDALRWSLLATVHFKDDITVKFDIDKVHNMFVYGGDGWP